MRAWNLGIALLVLALMASVNPVWSQDEEDEDDLESYVEEVVAAADEFWRDQARRLGFRYTTPEVRSVAHDERVRSQCGRSRGTNHSYCPAESIIYLDYDADDESLEDLWENEKPFVIVTIVGHEWGHHIQNILGIFDDASKTSVDFELQADCLMGVFTRAYQRDSDWVERRDVRDAILSTTESGDDEDTPRSEMTHGTADQRLAAFFRGYRSGTVQNCGI